MPDLEIHSSQTNQKNFGYENCVQNRDEQQFSKRKSYNLFHKINYEINIINFPTHRTKVLWKNITRNHLKKMKNTCTSLEVSLGNSKQTPSLSFFFSFSLFFLSLLSPFLSFSYGPKGPQPLSPLVWSTKGAIGGIKLPPFPLNRPDPTYFCFSAFIRAPGPLPTGRPVGQFFRIRKLVNVDHFDPKTQSFLSSSIPSYPLHIYIYIYFKLN